MSNLPDLHFERDYYEDEFNWDNLKLNQWIQEKINVIKSIIPPDVKTIADIGCGNGIITHSFDERFIIVGVDRSRTALKSFRFRKINGDISHIPLKERSVDLVISSEVLEHLPGENLFFAVTELKRISRKYIMITVPNQENLKKNNVKCPACRNVFNVSMHYNSFNRENLEKLFGEYKLLKLFETGKPVRQYNDFLLSIRQNLGNVWGRFAEERRVICPACGEKFMTKPGKNFISIFCDGLNRLFCRPKPYWLGGLFKKRRI